MYQRLHSSTAPITVRVVDYGEMYYPGSIGGPQVSYLHVSDGTVVRIEGAEWAAGLRVTALCWHGYVPDREDSDKTWMTRVRHAGATHRQVRAWWTDELAGLHRDGAAA